MSKSSRSSISYNIRKLYILIFILLLSISLGVAVLMMSQTLQKAFIPSTDTTGQIPTISLTTLDQNTINQINALHISDNASDPTLPAGRINPFSN